jgi:nucleolar protein 56
MIKLVTNVLGVFALKDGRIIKKILFPSDAKEIALRLSLSEEGVCPEEESLIKDLTTSGIKELFVQNPSRFLGKGLQISVQEDKKAVDPYAIAQELGFPRAELQALISEANIELTKRKLRIQERDQILMQAVASLDDVEEVSNRLMERLREWYSLHFPELDTLVVNQSLYARLVALPDKTSIDGGLAQQIEDAKSDTVGMEFTESDTAEVRKLAEAITKIDSFKADTETYLAELMKEIAPNTGELAGPLLGARLIAIAGGLERLSKLPASTIQVLGAEEAFFRFLRTHELPPKHGTIFQLPEIRSAPKHLRGKIARKFAAKLAITAKSDFFHGEYVGGKIRADFLKGVELLKKQPEKRKPASSFHGGRNERRDGGRPRYQGGGGASGSGRRDGGGRAGQSDRRDGGKPADKNKYRRRY